MPSQKRFTNSFHAMEEIIPGVSKVRIAFGKGTGKKLYLNEAARAAICYFSLMRTTNLVLTDGQEMLCLAIIQSGYYDHDNNRTFEVLTRSTMNKRWFASRFSSGVESITVINPVEKK